MKTNFSVGNNNGVTSVRPYRLRKFEGAGG